jgi:hypothetical protein
MRYSEHDEIPAEMLHSACSGAGCARCHYSGADPWEAAKAMREEQERDEALRERWLCI